MYIAQVQRIFSTMLSSALLVVLLLAGFTNIGHSAQPLLSPGAPGVENSEAAPVPLGAAATTPQDAARLLIQATYGPTRQAINEVVRQGPALWLDNQFRMPARSHFDTLRAIQNQGVEPGHFDLQESMWKQAVKGTDQLRQRVAFALSEIFVISQRDTDLINHPMAFAAYHDMLGKHAFGNFRTLLEDVTLHHAMGFYLDMLGSAKEDAVTGRTPNENYAREVLQLFSVGLVQLNQDGTPQRNPQGEPLPTYGQQEVLGFAKAFSGWSHGTNPRTEEGFLYQPWPVPKTYWRTRMQAFPQFHSTGPKQLLGGVILPADQTPEQDLKDALDNIFYHPNVGPFIGKQLIQKLVTSNPSTGYVSRVAAAFADNGSGKRGDMTAVLQAILLDSEARDAQIAQSPTYGKLREPLIRLANLVRAFRGTSSSGQYGFWGLDSPEWGVAQAHYWAPSVFNFFHPDYVPPGPLAMAGLSGPEFEITTDTTIVTSSGYLHWLIFYGAGHTPERTVYLNYAALTPMAAAPVRLVDHLALLLCAGQLSPVTRNAVINAVKAYPADQPLERVTNAIYLIAVSPDFAIQK